MIFIFLFFCFGVVYSRIYRGYLGDIVCREAFCYYFLGFGCRFGGFRSFVDGE